MCDSASFDTATASLGTKMNFTSLDAPWNPEPHWLKKYYDKSVLSILVLIMFSMGCTIRWKEVSQVEPRSVEINVMSWYVKLSFG